MALDVHLMSPNLTLSTCLSGVFSWVLEGEFAVAPHYPPLNDPINALTALKVRST